MGTKGWLFSTAKCGIEFIWSMRQELGGVERDVEGDSITEAL